jgi:hypothetical protein
MERKVGLRLTALGRRTSAEKLCTGRSSTDAGARERALLVSSNAVVLRQAAQIPHARDLLRPLLPSHMVVMLLC